MIMKHLKLFESITVDDKLAILKNYIQILKKSDKYSENFDSNCDLAVAYFTIIYNFLIIEEMFHTQVVQANKELNKYLDIIKLDNENDIMDKFFELYEPNHNVRFAVETFDSIEDIRIYLGGHKHLIGPLAELFKKSDRLT